MRKTGPRPRPSLLLLWLTCALVTAGCRTTGPSAQPVVQPRLPPPPPNVMRPPRAEKQISEILFESGETPTIN